MTAWPGVVAVGVLRNGQILTLFGGESTWDLLTCVIEDGGERSRAIQGILA